MVAVEDNRIADRFCGMSLKVSLIFFGGVRIIGALGQLIIPIRNHIEYCDVNTDTTCRVISNNEFAGNLSISAFGILLVFMAIFGSIMNNNKFLIASLAIDAIQLIILPFVSWYILSSYENHDYGAVVEPLVNYAYMGIIMVYMILAISRYEEIKSSKMYPLADEADDQEPGAENEDEKDLPKNGNVEGSFRGTQEGKPEKF
ncbi:uncharacterized protein LOC123270330 [Cotesia glomerata]|uniref:uncharacterized protein LOC123270330 n=1 Tax=Cotesia glomerata TaxID=32391 RepID=UPI001D00E3A9|nr:uncharacterized protein LOC123270330 [Cotesia glomerata]